MEKYFCSNCGSQLTDRYLVPVSAELQPHMVWVHIGTLDDPEIVTIEDHYGVESQLSWVHFDDGLPRKRCDEDPGLAKAFAAARARDESGSLANVHWSKIPHIWGKIPHNKFHSD